MELDFIRTPELGHSRKTNDAVLLEIKYYTKTTYFGVLSAYREVGAGPV